MGMYKDVTIFCDLCFIEGASTTSAEDCRLQVKEEGWVRRKIDGKWADVCFICVQEGTLKKLTGKD